MVDDPISNVDRLIEAGILDPQKQRTQDQTEAIESLTEQEVDALISSRDKLQPDITEEDDLIHFPGIPSSGT